MSIKREISFFWIFINPKRLVKPQLDAHLRCRRSEGDTSPNIMYQTKEHELKLVSFKINIPNSPVSHMLFEVSEWPFHRVANTALAFVCFLLLAGELWATPFPFVQNTIVNIAFSHSSFCGFVCICLVGEYGSLITTQQIFQLPRVMHTGSGETHPSNNVLSFIDADMAFIAVILSAAFLCAGCIMILLRTPAEFIIPPVIFILFMGSLNKSRINQRPLAENDIPFIKLFQNVFENLLQKTGFNKTFAKTPYCRKIRYLCIKTDAQETLKTQAADEGILKRRIAQIIQKLKYKAFQSK